MIRLAAPLLILMVALGCAPAHAQAGTAPPPAAQNPQAAPSPTSTEPPTPEDICRTVEEAAAENSLPVEFFARVIWQESRFNALAISPKGAEGIAQFMPRTASWHGLADPFDPIEALRHSAEYLRELRDQFGNLGLAAAAYNAGPGRVSAWLANHRALPGETRNYVAVVTGWTADEWASPSPPQNSETTIPQGVPCTRLANLILAPKEQAQRIAAYIPRWGVQIASHLSEAKAWAIYRKRAEALRFADRRSRADRAAQTDTRNGHGAALHHHHRRRQPRPARHIMRQAHRRRRRLRRAAEQARLSSATFVQWTVYAASVRSTSANCEISQRVNQHIIHGIGMRKIDVTARTSTRQR